MPRKASSPGEYLREVRQARGMTLADVAGRASISVATLSRIENDRQRLDVDVLRSLADILGVSAADALGGPSDVDEVASITLRLAGLDVQERARVFRDATRRRQGTPLHEVIEELLLMLDMLRDELQHAQRASRRRRR